MVIFKKGYFSRLQKITLSKIVRPSANRGGLEHGLVRGTYLIVGKQPQAVKGLVENLALVFVIVQHNFKAENGEAIPSAMNGNLASIF